MAKKEKRRKPRREAKKTQATAKSSGKKAASKRKAARKPSARRRPVRETQAVGTQSVETVQLKRRTRAAAEGAAGGDFSEVSMIESADSESAGELLEEGQTFESGIVSGVENARDPDEGEVRTHEVPQDDVPEEYDDKDRP